jgi:hypothetical protein
MSKETAISVALASEMVAICEALGCIKVPGTALRFVKQLQEDVALVRARNVELLRSWDKASPTERQELDRLRRGWGPSTPTERQARLSDLRECMNGFSAAMDAVAPDGKEVEEPAVMALQGAYDRLNEGYKRCISKIHAIADLKAAEPRDHIFEEKVGEIRAQIAINVQLAKTYHPEASAVDGKRVPHSQEILAGHIEDRLKELEALWAPNLQAQEEAHVG